SGIALVHFYLCARRREVVSRSRDRSQHGDSSRPHVLETYSFQLRSYYWPMTLCRRRGYGGCPLRPLSVTTTHSSCCSFVEFSQRITPAHPPLLSGSAGNELESCIRCLRLDQLLTYCRATRCQSILDRCSTGQIWFVHPSRVLTMRG